MTRPYPPGPASRVPLKLFLDFRRDPLGFIETMQRYGDVSHIKLGGQHVYLLNDPDLIKSALLDTSGRFTKGRALGRARVLLGTGLLTSEGELHTRQKRLMMPAFHRTGIPLYGKAMVDCAHTVMGRWRDGQELDLWTEMMRVTLDIAGSTLFGATLESEAVEISSALSDIIQNFDLISLPGQDLLRHLPLPSSIRFRRAHKRLDEVVYRIIRQRRESGEERTDLLSMLLKARDQDDGSQMTDTQVRDEVMTLFMAGHETTSNALTWCWHLLGENPDCLAKMEEELSRVLGDRRPSAADYPNLKYTEMVFAEALRLFPPAWVVGRRVKNDDSFGGWQVPKMSIVLISQWLMHRDARHWDEPLAFRPERFTAEAKAGRRPFTYFPFSAGPRGCIGEGFAWMEGTLLLAAFAQEWRFEPLPGRPVSPLPQITLRPKQGLKVRLKKRNV